MISFRWISSAGRARKYPPFVPRVELTNPALFSSHISFPAFAVEMPSRSAIWGSVSDLPSFRFANCTRHLCPYSSCAEIFINQLRTEISLPSNLNYPKSLLFGQDWRIGTNEVI